LRYIRILALPIREIRTTDNPRDAANPRKPAVVRTEGVLKPEMITCHMGNDYAAGGGTRVRLTLSGSPP
jgi:hypothetical protein